MEKVTAIEELVQSNNKDWSEFLIRKKEQEDQNEEKLHFIREQIIDLDIKLQAKEAEISLLSDTMTRRAKHEADMAKIRAEMEQTSHAHKLKMEQLDKSLLETRMTLQREAECKIKNMESAAQEVNLHRKY